MNKIVTSRAQLLAAAKEIAYSQGLSHVSIRAVAASCGVAVGSLYNYFPTKADLIAAVMEDSWQGAIHRDTCRPEPGESFTAFVGRMYADLAQSLSAFRSDWLEEIGRLGAAERSAGRALESQCFSHMQNGLLLALRADPTAHLPPPLAEEDGRLFVAFVFRNLMHALRTQAPDCAYLCRLMDTVLYR
ncbi:MAG: helix-turn-helix domain-containing protein [Pseudoflavonifractor sp.]